MKLLQTLLLLIIFSFNSFSQESYSPNEEDLVLFNGIEKSINNSFTPYVSWPIECEEENGIFTYDIAISKVNSTNLPESNVKELISAKIINKSILRLETSFHPHSEKMLAKVLFSLGVENTYIQGKKVSIYKYAPYFKTFSHNEIRKTRVYLK